jgi:hypothetical protein
VAGTWQEREKVSLARTTTIGNHWSDSNAAAVVVSDERQHVAPPSLGRAVNLGACVSSTSVPPCSGDRSLSWTMSGVCSVGLLSIEIGLSRCDRDDRSRLLSRDLQVRWHHFWTPRGVQFEFSNICGRFLAILVLVASGLSITLYPSLLLPALPVSFVINHLPS